MVVTRFAPSPNGHLHLGHAFSAIVAHDLAVENNGKFLLRIEDIDGARSRSELADEFRVDLEWLGLTWDEVPAQSTRLASYQTAIDQLLARDLLYRCTCTRAEIRKNAIQSGAEGPLYPGTCKDQRTDESLPAVLRLDLDRAIAEAGEIIWTDEEAGSVICDPRDFGDVVLVRKDEPASYHLAATLDDAADGVTHVTRGSDLFAASHVHRLLQELLELPVPHWCHHPILLDTDGLKLAKRRNSPSLADLRNAGEDGRLLAEQLRLRRLPSGISLESA